MTDINVKAIRKAIEVSKEQLAKMIGVSTYSIDKYEKGGVIPESKRKLLLKLKGRNIGDEKLLAAITGTKNLVNAGTISGNIISGSTINNSTIDFSTPEGIQLLKDRVIELEKENERYRRDKINLEKLVSLMEDLNK
ncbi:helix-turn-helix domain-containing protein [Bacteroides propionicifaciens]|uniref:helix-turn-helix domain-containing protein n=1 Tax=Bacteroides propionicifaciens TaxID=392838 RepID=UPI0003681A72|nr:helix-turn-helix transcriptional regulator [Bacteroides propionicifaciens]